MTSAAQGFAMDLGGAAGTPGTSIAVRLPVLRGGPYENLFRAVHPVAPVGGVACFDDGFYRVGVLQVEVREPLDATTRRLYAQVFEAARGRALCRIWNFVPQINEAGPDGLENYRAFSKGRSEAFEAAFGEACTAHMPAASAVGCDESRLTVVFAAALGPARHVENPLQVPAFRYPPEHGPRPPSFARATVVDRGDDTRDVFISGTSSIRGHQTVAPGDTSAQLACTFENLTGLARACGLDEALAAGRATERRARVYLRDAQDLDLTVRAMAQRFPDLAEQTTVLRADICRADLNVEVEVSLVGVR